MKSGTTSKEGSRSIVGRGNSTWTVKLTMRVGVSFSLRTCGSPNSRIYGKFTVSHPTTEGENLSEQSTYFIISADEYIVRGGMCRRRD